MANKKYDQISIKFNDFYEREWQTDLVYVPSDFITTFNIDRHLARYYLMQMVYEKKLFRVKYTNKTFYVKYNEKLIDKFKEYTWLGVQITK